MLDLSQFKRSEEEVHAQIEAKQAPMSEIIEEKVKKKSLIHANHRNEIREKGKKSNTVSRATSRYLAETYAPDLIRCKRLDKYDKG